MNILENIKFEGDNANVIIIKKDEKIKYFAVGLGNGGILKKHTTAVPATLIVLKGKINFRFRDRELILNQFETFEIPVNEEHEVTGILDENLFTVLQQL